MSIAGDRTTAQDEPAVGENVGEPAAEDAPVEGERVPAKRRSFRLMSSPATVQAMLHPRGRLLARRKIS